jgi:hypothetical protein
MTAINPFHRRCCASLTQERTIAFNLPNQETAVVVVVVVVVVGDDVDTLVLCWETSAATEPMRMAERLAVVDTLSILQQMCRARSECCCKLKGKKFV